MIEAREAEHRVGAGAQRRLRSERADDRVEQARVGLTTRGHPGRREDLAECPDRTADVIPDVRLVEPAPVVPHEVPHPRPRVGRVLEERERAVEDRRPDLLVAAAGELERDDCEARDVVDAVAGLAVRDHAVRVLDDPDVVDEREQVVGAHAHELRVEAGERPAAARRQLDGLAQHRRRGLGDRRPGQLARRSAAPRPGRPSSRSGSLDVAADGVRECCGVAERHELAGARREHVLRVPVGRRDDAAAGCEAEGERARGDLLAPPVRGDEDVGRCEQVGDLLDRQKRSSNST